MTICKEIREIKTKVYIRELEEARNLNLFNSGIDLNTAPYEVLEAVYHLMAEYVGNRKVELAKRCRVSKTWN